jgi:hypothetical protein
LYGNGNALDFVVDCGIDSGARARRALEFNIAAQLG